MKGITPVIAVVLLLLITVGAVGAAFGLFQQLRGQAEGQTDQFSDAQRAANTDIQFDIVEKTPDEDDGFKDGSTNLTIRNIGQRGIGLSNELSLQFQPPEESSPLPPSAFADLYGDEYDVDSEDEIYRCFDNTSQSLAQEDTFECATNVSFPEIGESITFVVNYEQSQRQFSYTCEPSGTGNTC